ncbi:MAG: energy-coupling factor transporter ATPase [Clostridia bacterium]|nr:energy-coupling factor transporter ATPase [Clostridia bacterium]MBQ6233870.1 energy-coupling factor transporter ATPase [Clostridia bacterium]
MQLTFDHVTHTYQPGSPFQATAIRDISLTIGSGEFTALIGHTGSGKSTLAQHMNALLSPTEGRVLLDGRDINEKGVSKRDVRQRIGLVFQYAETQLFEETVAKDVAFGPKNLGLSPEETDTRVREALERVGLSYADIAERSPFELSGGQMRRVAIAGVIAMRPEMLVLDEPAAGLDPLGRQEIMALVQGFHRAGTTVVMISHSMDDVAETARRIIVMDQGKLTMDGTPEAIFADAERLVELDLDVPQTCRMSLELRRTWPDFPMCVRADEAYEALLTRLKGGKAHA